MMIKNDDRETLAITWNRQNSLRASSQQHGTVDLAPGQFLVLELHQGEHLTVHAHLVDVAAEIDRLEATIDNARRRIEQLVRLRG